MPYVLSVGQFRPEKDHALQVQALAALKYTSNLVEGLDSIGGRHSSFDNVRLVIVGSCRNDEDRAVLARTRALTRKLGVEHSVQFVVNCSFPELKVWLGRASVGLHTMWNEHFGIGVVEMMVSVWVFRATRCMHPPAASNHSKRYTSLVLIEYIWKVCTIHICVGMVHFL